MTLSNRLPMLAVVFRISAHSSACDVEKFRFLQQFCPFHFSLFCSFDLLARRSKTQMSNCFARALLQ